MDKNNYVDVISVAALGRRSAISIRSAHFYRKISVENFHSSAYHKFLIFFVMGNRHRWPTPPFPMPTIRYGKDAENFHHKNTSSFNTRHAEYSLHIHLSSAAISQRIVRQKKFYQRMNVFLCHVEKCFVVQVKFQQHCCC